MAEWQGDLIVSTVYDRWELVEPLLFAHTLRDPQAFREGATKCGRALVLERIRREHRADDAAIAQAFALMGDEVPTAMDGDLPIHAVIRERASRWLVANGDHWSLRIESRSPGHEIIRWRALTMLVPPSIVVAGALADSDSSHPLTVQTLPDSLAPRGLVGHLHVHLGPMLPFEALWMGLWNAFLQGGTLDAPNGEGIDQIKHNAQLKKDALPEIGWHDSKRQPGLRWQWLLELAFAARLWLDGSGNEPAPPRASGVRSWPRRRCTTTSRLDGPLVGRRLA